MGWLIIFLAGTSRNTTLQVGVGVSKGRESTIQWDEPKIYGLKPDLPHLGRFLVGERVHEMDSKRKIAIRRKVKKLMIQNYNLFLRRRINSAFFRFSRSVPRY